MGCSPPLRNLAYYIFAKTRFKKISKLLQKGVDINVVRILQMKYGALKVQSKAPQFGTLTTQ